MMRKNSMLRKYMSSILFFLLFETVAITLWLVKDNLFYLLNFSYIGTSLAIALLLFARRHPHARRVSQLLIGTYMLVYLGLICQENMQIEGFWYYTASARVRELSVVTSVSPCHSHTANW